MGRILAVIVIALIAVAALGFYRNWWQVNQTSSNGNVDITLRVDKDKIKQDTNTATEQVRKTGDAIREKAAELADRDTVRGKVAVIDAVKGIVTVAPEKAETVTVHTTDKTVIKRNDVVIPLSEVQVDQPVMVVYATEDGKRMAKSITVETR